MVVIFWVGNNKTDNIKRFYLIIKLTCKCESIPTYRVQLGVLFLILFNSKEIH